MLPPDPLPVFLRETPDGTGGLQAGGLHHFVKELPRDDPV